MCHGLDFLLCVIDCLMCVVDNLACAIECLICAVDCLLRAIMFAGDGREDRLGALDRPSEEGPSLKVVRAFTWTPRPESGLDCLMCAMFVQRRLLSGPMNALDGPGAVHMIIF